jgi:hypothetical protein
MAEKFDLNGFVDEINNLQKAKGLLQTVWLEIGPYGHGKISAETRDELNNFFKFDDSE